MAFKPKESTPITRSGPIRMADTDRGAATSADYVPTARIGLRESYADLAKALEAGGVGTWTVGLKTDSRMWWSPQTLRILGLPPGAPIGRDVFFGLLHPDERETVREALAEAVRLRRPYAGEHRIVRPDGAERWVRGRAAIELNAAGEPVALVGIVQDVTEARQAEAIATATSQRFRELVQHMPVLLDALDVDGRIIFWNEECERVTGYTTEEVLGDPAIIEKLYPDIEYRTRMMREWAEKGNRYRDWEWTLTCKDGSKRTIAWSNISDQFPIDGWPRWGIGVDVTERKQLEQQFMQSQKMEAIGRLAGGIAHDFNNLLTVIAGYTEVVLGELSSSHPHRPALEQIRRAGDRAASLTRQLLLFTRRQLLEARPLDLNHVVRDMDRMLRRVIGDELELAILAAPEPCPVKIDPGQVEQVLMNLAVNARDAMPGGGRLTVETAPIEISARPFGRRSALDPGSYIVLRVTDTGIGMPPDTLSHIFEPFFTTKAPGQGSGLGLATVFGIVQQNKGHIEVSSATGLGTTFTIYLPRTNEPVSQSGSHRVVKAQQRGDETILLVEDDDDVRELAREALVLRGYKVLDVRDGSEAFLRSQQYGQQIHLLVSDVVMPVMSGPQVAELITLHRPDIKVLFISGYTGDLPFLDQPSTQPRTLLYKPFTMDMLARKVRDVLDG
jgi:two-component system cell cycle sensor histidine kinase/response regulator CckA